MHIIAYLCNCYTSLNWTILKYQGGVSFCCYIDLASIASLPTEVGDTALKNKICTIHSTIHMYDRCLTINCVCILMFIVSNHLCYVEYTYSLVLLFTWSQGVRTGLETQVHYGSDRLKKHPPGGGGGYQLQSQNFFCFLNK